MLWLKAFHIIFVVTWFAGLFYLPRLFVYHAMATDPAEASRLQVMERRLFGIMTVGAALALIFGLGLVASGSALNRPPTFGLISIHTSADHQGTVLGVTQSAGSLARILAPIAANLLFRHHPATPYIVCAAIAAIVGLVTWVQLCRRPATPQAVANTPEAIATRTPP